MRETRLNILAIDDNEFILDILGKYLAKNNYSVDTADSGAAGLQKYLDRTDYYDVILLDIQMPVMGGFEVLQQIRENKSMSDIPVVAMSGTYDEHECKGFNFFLRKPFELNEVLALLDRVLNDK